MTVECTISPAGAVSTAAYRYRLNGQSFCTLVVKATFAYDAKGELTQVEPAGVVTAERHLQDNPMASIALTRDLAPRLGRADVIYVGSAYSPRAEPVGRLNARLAVLRGETPILDKTLTVFGTRYAAPGEPPSEPEPFVSMPLRYEHAFGGIGHADNPLGVGIQAGRDGRVKQPNVEYPKGRGHGPAGFAPISMVWAARKKLLGSRARADVIRSDADLDDAFDWSFFQNAPLDQQTELLRGDERVLLRHLHPTEPALLLALPSVALRALVYRGDNPPVELPLIIDTLWIDGDASRLSLVARASVLLDGALSVRALGAVSVHGAAIPWAQWTQPVRPEGHDASRSDGAERVTAPLEDEEPEEGSTLVIEDPDAVSRPAFAGTMVLDPDSDAAPSGRPTLPIEVREGPPAPPAHPHSGTMIIEADAPTGPATPFRGTPGVAPAVPPSPRIEEARHEPAPAEHPLAGTQVLSQDEQHGAGGAPSTPFGRRARADVSNAPAGPIPGAPWGQAAAKPPRPAHATTMELEQEEAPGFAPDPDAPPATVAAPLAAQGSGLPFSPGPRAGPTTADHPPSVDDAAPEDAPTEDVGSADDGPEDAPTADIDLDSEIADGGAVGAEPFDAGADDAGADDAGPDDADTETGVVEAELASTSSLDAKPVPPTASAPREPSRPVHDASSSSYEKPPSNPAPAPAAPKPPAAPRRAPGADAKKALYRRRRR